MARLWRNLKDLVGVSTPQDLELNRSRYSLVSCGELTADTLQLWMELPEEVKFDPTLAPLRQMYEKEHGKLDNGTKKGNGSKGKTLHIVKSAPQIVNEPEVLKENGNSVVPEEVLKEDAITKSNEEIPVNTCFLHDKRERCKRGRHFTKMTILLACWLFFTTIFLTYNEKKEVLRHTFLTPGEIKHFPMPSSADVLSIELKLTGPFVSEHTEMKLNSLQHQHLEAWLERWTLRNGSKVADDNNVIEIEKSPPWLLTLLDEDELDFNAGETRSSKLRLSPNQSSDNTVFAIGMRKSGNGSTPFTMTYSLNPVEVGTGVVYAVILLFGLYTLIIFEVINRTMAAVVISTASLAVLALVGERPSVPEVVSWLDIETLILLFSMMILVAIMAETGIFDFLAVYTFEVTQGKLWPLIFLLCNITAVLSTFLDNVTTVLLMSPVTIRLCEVMELDPVPILMFMAIFSNVGGTATPVGDPPNVIVASNKAVIQSGIHFTNFTAHMALGILFVVIQTCLQIRFMFRDTNKLRLNVPRDIQDLRHQISIWRRAAESLPHLSQGVNVVRERLEKKINKLSLQLEILVKERKTRACPKDTFQSTLTELKGKYKIRDKKLLLQATVAITFVVVVFFLHSIPELNRVSLGWTALLGAVLLLLLADREDLEPILHRVEWTTLLFFAALFVLMEALSKLGLILYVGGLMEQLILSVDESARLAVAIMLILWVSGLISGFVDNIPLTTMMVRVVVTIGSNPRLDLPLPPLIWALLYGACLGGNSTLIAASANVVCAGVAEQHGYKFTFMQFFRVGFPIVIGHLIVSSAYLLICHCVLEWHL